MKRKSRHRVLLDILLIDLGMFFLYQFLTGQSSSWWVTNLLLGANLVWLGYREMIRALQTLEVDEVAITHQISLKIIRVRWNEIKTYSLSNKRFIAIGKQGQTLLDLNLQSNDDKKWPVHECAKIKQWIQRKMNEVGALQESTLSLRNNHGLKIKL